MAIDITGAKRKLSRVEKQARFATARALTQTAKDAQQAITRDMPRIFDRPIQFTQRAIAITPARTSNLEAWVFAKDRQAEYLAIQEVGGTRRPESGAPVVVPVNIRTNVAGNIPRGKIKREVAKPTTFVASKDDPRTRHLPPGIYQRRKRRRKAEPPAPRLLVAIERQAEYGRRFGFKERVNRVVIAKFPDRFRESLRHALATAR